MELKELAFIHTKQRIPCSWRAHFNCVCYVSLPLLVLCSCELTASKEPQRGWCVSNCHSVQCWLLWNPHQHCSWGDHCFSSHTSHTLGSWILNLMTDKMLQAWKVDPKKPGSPLPLLEVWGRDRLGTSNLHWHFLLYDLPCIHNGAAS